MKLAYMYATPDVGHHQVTAIQGPTDKILPLIKEIGYTGVELLVRDPRAFDQGNLRQIVSQLGLEVPAICTGEIYGEDLVSFADPDPSIRSEAIDRMKASMELASEYGAMVNVGRLRGRYTEGIHPAQTIEWMQQAIHACSQAYHQVPIVIEPVNHQYANCLLNTRDTLQFIEELKLPNVGIMLDTVHVILEGENLAESIRLSGNRFLHFHISDSDRLPPGFGEYDLESIMHLLLSLEYKGYVTIESFQKPSAEIALEQSFATLSRYFK